MAHGMDAIVANRPRPRENHGVADVVVFHHPFEGHQQIHRILEPQHDDALKFTFNGVAVGRLVAVGFRILRGPRWLDHDRLGDLRRGCGRCHRKDCGRFLPIDFSLKMFRGRFIADRGKRPGLAAVAKSGRNTFIRTAATTESNLATLIQRGLNL